MKKYSKKGWEKRKKDREGLGEFFEMCISKIKKEQLHCEECGSKLQGHVSEVAHIIGKSYYKSISTNPLNWLPLCGMYSEKQCHSKFDDSKIEVIREMKIRDLVKERFLQIEPYIEEKINYKTYDRYTED